MLSFVRGTPNDNCPSKLMDLHVPILTSPVLMLESFIINVKEVTFNFFTSQTIRQTFTACIEDVKLLFVFNQT